MTKAVKAARSARSFGGVPPKASAKRKCSSCAIRLANQCWLYPPSLDFRWDDLAGVPLDVRGRRAVSDLPGSSSAQMVVVCSGLAYRCRSLRGRHRQVLAFLMPGELISAHMALTDSAAPLAYAVTDLNCMTFDRDAVRRYMFSRREIHERVTQFCAVEHDRAETLAVELGCCTGFERVGRFLLRYARQMYERGWDADLPVPFPIGQNLLADMLGMTVTHVGRILTHLREDGLIEIRGGRIVFLDIQRLGGIADVGLHEMASRDVSKQGRYLKGQPS